MAPRQNLDEEIEPNANNEVFKNEILYDGKLYDVSTFLHGHPGGNEILLNFAKTGEDATLAIQQFHARSIDRVLKIMGTLRNRPEPQIKRTKEAEKITQRNTAMTADFVKLYEQIKKENLFAPSISHWINRFVELIAYGLLGFSLITESSYFFPKFIGSFLFAFGMARGSFMMHEFGHISGSGHPKLDRFLQELLFGISTGLSALWWRRDHSLHHAQTNRLESDPAIYILPGLLLFNPKTLEDPEKDATFFERNQMYFLPIYMFIFYLRWIFWDSFPHLYRGRKIVEIVSIFCHYAIMYQIGLQMWLITASFYSVYLFTHLFLSHTFVEVTDEPLHWVEQCFVTTVNINPGCWMDWWMGYLNYQIEHHLFPTLPEYQIPLIVDRVKALAEKHGLPYHVYSYEVTIRKALGNLKHVSDFLRNIG